MQESFWWRQCSDMYIISLFPYHHTPPPNFSPSLISLMFLWTLSTMFTYLPLLPLRQQSPIYVRNRINTNLGTSFACLLTLSTSLCCLATKIFWEKGPSPYSSHILELQCPLRHSHRKVHSIVHTDSQNVSVQK